MNIGERLRRLREQSQSPYGEASRATVVTGPEDDLRTFRRRNPLTGKHLVQLYPLKNTVLDMAPGGGVCENHEGWNMHMAYTGGFAGFGPMKSHRRKGR